MNALAQQQPCEEQAPSNVSLAEFAYQTWRRQADLLSDAAEKHIDKLRAAHNIWADIALQTADMLRQPQFIPPAHVLNRLESYPTAEILAELDSRMHRLRNYWYAREADFAARQRYNQMRELALLWHRRATLNNKTHEMVRGGGA